MLEAGRAKTARVSGPSGLGNYAMTLLAIGSGLVISACAHQSGPRVSGSEPAADPSTQVTRVSSSKPDRNEKATEPGHSIAQSMLTPVSDCDAVPCTGEAPGELVAAVRDRATQARGCYERALQKMPTLSGRVLVGFRLTRDGRPCEVKLLENELKASDIFTPCLQRLLAEGHYPLPRSGCVDLEMPLKFVPQYVDAGTEAATGE